MLTVISDTHGTDSHRLTGRTLDAVRAADHVVHAGDFTTEAVYDAIAAEAAELTAVTGNNERRALRERLPAEATVEWGGYRLLVVHGHRHSDTALGMLARQEGADIVVVGHSHRPEIRELDGRLLVNPGSYADPRRYRPAHAELDVDDGALRVRLRSPDGDTFETVTRPR
ncbi:metallophosphoesterase [Haloarcula onubensis]|uniref:Phosphoesterase n=1 Tax=Haloarcula onubensis TaxID=2950539 RepID=A0ABU2FP99_9EURY|nr:metallophosphoesterase [Halomicroarcula sp. S3CR25-11]MDS0282586.1 metallophosphoesterase [Halomicroarcula sp. S3CR25-11]